MGGDDLGHRQDTAEASTTCPLPLCRFAKYLLGGCRPRPYSISLSLSLPPKLALSASLRRLHLSLPCALYLFPRLAQATGTLPSLALDGPVSGASAVIPVRPSSSLPSTDVAFVQVSLDSTIRCLTRTGPPEALRVATLSPHPRRKGPVKRVSMTSARQAIPVRIQWPPKCPGYLARLKAYRAPLPPRR